MALQFVKPYVKTNKNDAADAEAILEAVCRPDTRHVPVKNIEQQTVLTLHRVRQGFVRARSARANQIRGLLVEIGLTIPQGIGYIATRSGVDACAGVEQVDRGLGGLPHARSDDGSALRVEERH